ncbi:MAG: hypothetical protein KY466_00620, partial [Gemmatimonadetes bacterium]|nr:hypothetical protein [Gemmatimonadota bacterium]
MSRDKLMSYLWPESDSEHGRNLLKAATYVLRTALGKGALLSAGDDLRLNPAIVRTDVAEFEEALARADYGHAVGLYRAPFLDGFFLQDAPEFEHWVERERGRLAGRTAKALEALAATAEAHDDFPAASEWWQARAAHDPYDSRVALRLMQVLEASGNRAAALQHAAIHQRLLQEEVGTGTAPEVLALADRLRGEPPVALEPHREGFAAGTPPPNTPEFAPLPIPQDSPAPPSPAIGRPAPPRRHSPVRSGLVALLFGAALFGAPWLWRARSVVPPPAVQETSIAVLPQPDRSTAAGDVALALATLTHRPHTQNVAAYELYRRG